MKQYYTLRKSCLKRGKECLRVHISILKAENVLGNISFIHNVILTTRAYREQGRTGIWICGIYLQLW